MNDVEQMPIEIPTLLSNSRNKMIQLRLQNNKTIRGILQDFDAHQNLVLDDVEDISDTKAVKLGKILLRGNNIIAFSIPKD
jgi:small nuclear ribonucleoprotein